MTQSSPDDRPNCEDILKDKHLWALNSGIFGLKEDFVKMITTAEMKKKFLANEKISFIYYYLKLKLEQVTYEKYDYHQRLKTFKEWKVDFVKPEHLAESGFYFLGFDDYVKCDSCQTVVYNWLETDDPRDEHAKWNPDCEYAKINHFKSNLNS
jgi:hypothetical protein